MSSCSVSTGCSCGSFRRSSSATTFLRSSPFWKYRWRDSQRHRWRLRGIVTDEQKVLHRRGGHPRKPAGDGGVDRGGLVLCPQPEQRLPRLLGREAAVPALCPTRLRPLEAVASRGQH